MLVRRLVGGACVAARAASVATPLIGIAEAVDASDAYRWCPRLDSVREGAGAALSLDSLRRGWGALATLARLAGCGGRCCWCAYACEWALGRVVVDCERCGRSEGLLTAWGRREEECERTTAGEVGAGADIVRQLLRKEQMGAWLESDPLSGPR